MREKDSEYYISLATKNEFIRQVILHHPGITIILSKDGNLIYCNDNFLELTGYKREEIINKNYFDIFIDKSEEVDEYFEQIINKTTNDIHYHMNHIIKKDKTKPLLMFINFTLEDNGKVKGTLSFAHDITFREEYFKDIKKINNIFINLGSDNNENIKKLIELSREISGAEFVLYNRIKDRKYLESFFCYGVDDFPKKFPLKGSLCELVINSKDCYIETDKIESDYLKSKNISYYAGFKIDNHENIFGSLCFFYKSKKYIKKERMSIIIHSILNEENKNKYLQSIEEKNKELSSLIDTIEYAVVIIDKNNRVVSFNNKFKDFFNKEISIDDDIYSISDLFIDKELFISSVSFLNSLGGVILKTTYEKYVKLHIKTYNERVFLGFIDITDEILSKKELSEYNKKLILYSEIDKVFIQKKIPELYSSILGIFVKNFACEYGLLGLVDNETKEFVIGGMYGNVAENCKIGDRIEYKKFLNTNSIWVRTIKDGKMYVLNQPKKINGHVPITNVVSFPIDYLNNTIGVLMLANRSIKWDDKILKEVGEMVSHVSQRLFYAYENEKLLKEKIENATRNLLSESITKITAGMAHDLNNMLVPILSSVSLIRDKIKDEELVELINDMDKHLNSIIDIAKEMLNIANPVITTPTPLKIEDLIKEIKIITNGFKLKLNLNNKCSVDFNFLIDRTQLIRVITNLISNAKYSMDQKGVNNIDIELGTVVSDEKKEFYIKVKDYGIGIKKEEISKIFDPYYTTKKYGRGLGLFTVRKIVEESMNGKVTVSSEYGAWACFTIVIPIRIPENKKTINKDKDYTISGKIKVIVIDDEDYVLKSIEKLLKHIGCDVFVVNNSKDAINAVKNNKFDIAIIDLIIQGDIDGWEINKKIKEIDPSIYSVLSTGYSDQSINDILNNYNFNSKLYKPYKLSDIKQLISSYLKKTNK